MTDTEPLKLYLEFPWMLLLFLIVVATVYFIRNPLYIY